MNANFETEKQKSEEVLNKKFSNGRLITVEFKMLWKEAEWIRNDIINELKEVNEKFNRAEDKKSEISLESDLRRKVEEIETLMKLREELERLQPASL